ncbi:uncharacterized protein TM35_000251580 [Trypanosoma theileri]|uniref:Uncharacterized protein n=1 Tax=Trypanosoma theileri TaxID=67003 RepID=A0A1X0NQ68_9TRYP|nr:uncharacterized protein TM35_000251580 [Trypanosoma theileri]ORC86862.1 hypothetical protein TM35_000251580 [Trypanosoma theileri]
MTTMFVQLRHMVYLLVLLQCCACATHVLAATPGFLDAEKAVQMSVKHTNQFISQVEGCLQLWKTKLPDCLEKCEKAKLVLPKLKNVVAGIEKDPDVKINKKVKGELREPLLGMVKQAKDLIPVAGDAARGCSVPAEMATVRGRMCAIHWGNLAPHVEGFPASLKYYELEKSGADDPNRAGEYLMSSYELYYRASNVTQEYSNKTGEIRRCMAFGHGDWKDVKKQVEELFRLIEDHGGSAVKVVEEAKWGELNRTREGEKEEQKKVDEKETKEGPGGVVVVKIEDKGVVEEVGFKRYGGKADQDVGAIRPRELPGDVGDFNADLENAMEEVALARKLAEEKARKEREEQERERERERKAEEERKERERVRKEKEEKARQIEREKQAAEKTREAEEKRKQQEREAAEKARQADEERKEQERQAAEKSKEAAKKKDGSSSPVLVHSSLILLVLSVLGCTLV